MIDTVSLEWTISATMTDSKRIHAAVKKVEKEPDYFSIEVVRVDTYAPIAMLRLVMAWEVGKNLQYALEQGKATPYGEWTATGRLIPASKLEDRVRASSGPANRLRYKWFTYVVDRLNLHGKQSATPLSFHETAGFEFWIGDGCVCAEIMIAAAPTSFADAFGMEEIP